MIFYDCATAPSPRRARMFLAEKGLEIETRQVDLRNDGHRAPEFLALNQHGTVPVLTTDEGLNLTENIAIAGYLEAFQPEPPLMGATPDEKGSVLMWNAICEFHGGMSIAETLRNASPALKGRALPGAVNYDQIPVLAERGVKRLQLFYTTLEKRLQERPWLAGDSFTMADITGYVFCDFARIVKMTPPEENTATQAWLDKISSRPSAKA
ncbi:glutathione S-transferase family protein [Shimia sagamensis]|uniref:Glutathione S-transferase n=1 Tax=Shimia sagamensis TaxID=1566352 RepID=A0ABY1P524_9RHOB|nr:glutathione S-transferase [Shimia sagamensis]SMP25740.1 glutathione S-transferase [Shimia sagamensis]